MVDHVQTPKEKPIMGSHGALGHLFSKWSKLEKHILSFPKFVNHLAALLKEWELNFAGDGGH